MSIIEECLTVGKYQNMHIERRNVGGEFVVELRSSLAMVGEYLSMKDARKLRDWLTEQIEKMEEAE